jgi:hypothetical protein
MTSEAWPRASKTSSLVKWSLALWAVFALAVFSITFDWQTRQAGVDFIRSQVARRAQGAPLDTIDHGFRPRVRSAAVESAVWPLVMFATAAGVTLMSSRRARWSR